MRSSADGATRMGIAGGGGAPRSPTIAAGFAAIVGERLRTEEPLAQHTTMRVGGPAEFFALANTTDEVTALVAAARAHDVPWRVIGRGSNLLVSEDGVRGLVIRNAASQIQFSILENDKWQVHAEAGASLARVAGECARRGLVGFAFAVAIPGTIGGAVVQNAGAHNRDMSEVLVEAECLDGQGRLLRIPVAALELGYRTSRVKRFPSDHTVLAATIAVRLTDIATAEREVDQIRSWRSVHQPAEPSAGSIFANPTGDHAGRLIDAAGLKGHLIGGAQISPRHANFIVNTGGAAAGDVLALIRLARQEVKRQFGVWLELEVELLGHWEPA